MNSVPSISSTNVNRTIVIAMLAALVLALLLGAVWDSQRQAKERMVAELERAQRSLSASARALNTSRDLSKQLEEKVGQLAEVLNQSTEKLNEAHSKLSQYETRGKPPVATGAVPAPVVSESKDRAGKVIKHYTFAKVLGKDGQLLAADVEFGSLYGRRLVFRRAAGSPLAFDVDEVHSDVLAHLQIDPDAAKYQQTQMDLQKKQREEAAYKDYLVRQAAERKAILIAKAEQAKAEEARRKQQAEMDLKYRELENDRIRAEAQLRSADAAMARAYNPSPTYYTYPLNGVPYVNGLPVYPVFPGTAPTAPTAPTTPTAPGGGTVGTGANSGQRGNFLPSAPMLPAQPMLPRGQDSKTPSSK